MRIERELLHRTIVATLFWLWLAQLLQATDNLGYMGDTTPVIWYIGVLIFSEFIPRRLLRVTLLTLMVLAILKWQYYPNISWDHPYAFVRALTGDMTTAIRGLFTGKWQVATDGVRTLAFFGVITFGTKLLAECVGRQLLLLACTAIGEALLVYMSFTYRINDTREIAVFLLCGLALLALGNLPRLQVLSKASRRADVIRLILAPLLLMGLMIAGGLVTPRPAVDWPTPTSWWQALARWFDSGLNGNQYDAHDNSLGGDFNGSNAVMLRVFANEPMYLRGEALDTYTDTGWVPARASQLALPSGSAIPPGAIGTMGPAASAPKDQVVERIQVVSGQYPVLFGGYQIAKVVLPRSSPSTYTLNLHSDTISAGLLQPGDTYTVTSELPTPSPADLAKVQDGNLAYAFPEDLELPANLPARDIQLARRITAGKSGTYAKIEAIIAYLQAHESYATHNIPTIMPGQDFVDQFLFVSHRGYCDHFSSALDVLARAVGIPSRWVKGFSVVPSNPNYTGTGYEYDFRGVNAHSWSEIWYAGYGWIPMEPTPSFVLPLGPQQKPVLTKTAREQPSTVLRSLPLHRITTAKDELALPGTQKWLILLSQASLWALLAGIFVLAGGLFVAYVFWFRRSRRKLRQRKTVEEHMAVLLVDFLRLMGHRRKEQTLRELSAHVTDSRLRAEVLSFVAWYERLRYGPARSLEMLPEGDILLRRLFVARGKGRRRSRQRDAMDSHTIST